MIKKKHTEKEPATDESLLELSNSATETEAPSLEPLVAETIDTDNEQLLKAKVEELNDKYLRLFSEFDNYRKRTIREKIDMGRTASEEVISSLLTILDDFERANKAFESKDITVEAMKEGIQLIYLKFRNILTQKGLKEMNATGEIFNTDFHEAITHIPAPGKDMKNKVLDEVEKGYLLNDKVIRYAKVVIGS
jgi:molecular chaperone GrpE